MMKYSYMDREVVDFDAEIEGQWDVFISAYNESERVQHLYSRIQAERKLWVVHPEYGLGPDAVPSGDVFRCDPDGGEAQFCGDVLREAGVDGRGSRICVDITGLMRPHMMCLVARLQDIGIDYVDVLYSEPVTYAKRERTEFSSGKLNVRQVEGLEGRIDEEQANDLLIIGAGFDNRQIVEVAEHKGHASKVVLLGFPPLSLDMYQQNLLRTSMARDALGGLDDGGSRYFAPANNPFVTASVLSEIVERSGSISNLYLSPLSTKAQALGFVLYYLTEWKGANASVLYPFSAHYASQTTKGLARTWRYGVEFGGRG